MSYDYDYMGCGGYREALSAQLDGEDEPVGRAELDAHLAACPSCRQWFDDAATVNRLVRTAPAVAAVDVTEAVLPAAPGPWRGRVALGLRVALGFLGVVQFGLALFQISTLGGAEAETMHGTAVDGATPGHLWHESVAWNVGVGAAFLWIAFRRGRPLGVLPILTAFIIALVVLSGADVIAGRVESLRLASHIFVLVGYLIVLALSGATLDLPPPGRRRESRPAPATTTLDDENIVALPRRDRSEPAAAVRYREVA